MKPFLIAAALAAGALTLSAPGLARAQSDLPAVATVLRGPVEVVVWNIRKSLGHIRVSLCTKLTFADSHKQCPYHAEAPAHAGATTVVIPDVPAGAYAAQVFQDEQDKNAVRRGPLGIPLDGIGFSNDAPIALSPPKFRDAAFDYDPASPLALRIKLRYFPNL